MPGAGGGFDSLFGGSGALMSQTMSALCSKAMI